MSRWEVEKAKELAKMKKEIKKQIDNLVPAIYACFAKALFDRGMDADEIEKLFADTQQIWTDILGEEDEMIDWVEKKTGISLRLLVEE